MWGIERPGVTLQSGPMHIARLSGTRARIDGFAAWFGPFFNFVLGLPWRALAPIPPKVGAPHPEEGAIYSCGGATMSAQAWIASGTPISYPLLVLNGLGSARIKAELVDEKRDE